MKMHDNADSAMLGGLYALPWIIVEESHLDDVAYSIWDRNGERVAVGLRLCDAQFIVRLARAHTPKGHGFPAGQGAGMAFVAHKAGGYYRSGRGILD